MKKFLLLVVLFTSLNIFAQMNRDDSHGDVAVPMCSRQVIVTWDFKVLGVTLFQYDTEETQYYNCETGQTYDDF